MTTRFTDDFNPGGSTWNSTNWTTSVSGTSASIDILSGEGRITVPNGSARYVYGVDKLTATSNQEVLVKVRSDQTTRNNVLVIGVAMSGMGTRPTLPTNGVYLRLPGTAGSAAQIVHYHSSTGTDSGTTPTNNLVGTGAYWIRFQHVSGIVKYKTWADGAAEPGTWDTTVDITGFASLPAGNVVLGVETTSSTTAAESYYFDDLTSTDATTAVNAGYTAQAMTSSALMTDAQAGISGGYNAQAMTASASLPNVDGHGNIQTGTILADTYTDNSSPTTNFGSDTTAYIGLNSGGVQYYTSLIKTSQPSLATGETLVAANLTLKASAAWPSDTYEIYRITSDWSEGTINRSNQPSMTLVATVDIPAKSSGDSVTIDISAVYAATNYGVALMRTVNGGSPAASRFYTKEHATSANRPTIAFSLGAVVDASPPATPLTASALMVDPTVSTTTGVSQSGGPMTATSTLVDPTVSVVSHIDIDAEPAQAAADMPGGGFAVPIKYNADPLEATALSVDPVVATERGPKINAAPMTATIRWVTPEAVNDEPIVLDESEDAYFLRVNSLGPESWWRLADTTSTVVDRIGNDANGAYLSVNFGQHNGPEDRASANFDGDGFIQGSGLETSLVPGTLEFSFRTTRANSYLMLTADDRVAGVATIDEPNREIYLTNGRITFKTWYFQNSLGSTPEPTTFTGTRNLADGEWHHIVVRPFTGIDGAGTEIWVDGKFEVRRYNAGSWNGMPDYVGGRPGIPTSQYLLGDMSEIVFYEKAISSDAIALNYYAFMGWAPIAVEPFEATAVMPEPRGKGNQKRALYLYWDRRSEWEKGGSAAEATTFDPMPEFVSTTSASEPVGDYHGFKVFAKSVRVKGDGTAYRDPATDEQSLINLDTDVDLGAFDVIMFKDWPDEGPELDDINGTYPGQKERLLGQIRDANNDGIGLFVTSPRLAIDLGVVNRVEFVPALTESRAVAGQGAARGLYDYGSAVKFPWNIAASDGLMGGLYATGTGAAKITDPTYLANKAFFYHDTNKNDRFRVRALIENLTDIPSYMIQDAVFHVDYDPWGWQGAAYKYLKREDGLLIGDEYMFNGAEIISSRYEDVVDRRYNRYSGTWATPAGNVLAGTVVTTFGATYWNGQSEIVNPYKDYATTIVVEPGDNLAGTTVGGKIFVNFTEQPSRGLGLPVQVLPDADNDVNWPFQYPVETDEQREWDYSWTRTTLRTTGNSSVTNVSIVLPTGETASIPLSGTADDLSMVRSNQLFPVEGKPRWEMDGRGMFWLSVKDEVNEGDVTVRADAINATAAAVQPAVVAERDADTKADPMVALVVMPKVAEDESGDADVYTLPLTAHATFTGYGKTVSAEPMLATAELVENFDLVHATGEQVVLYLHGVDVTLFIKEEA